MQLSPWPIKMIETCLLKYVYFYTPYALYYVFMLKVYKVEF